MDSTNVEFDFQEEGEFLWVKISGIFRQDVSGVFFREFLGKMSEYKCSKCLLDYSQGDFKGIPLTTFGRPRLMEDLGFSKENKIAGLFKEINSDVKFFKIVLENNGYKARLFTELDEALVWIKKS